MNHGAKWKTRVKFPSGNPHWSDDFFKVMWGYLFGKVNYSTFHLWHDTDVVKYKLGVKMWDDWVKIRGSLK